MNAYGWSLYSSTSHLLVAIVPEKAEKPVFVEADDDNIKITLNLNTANQGAEIEEHQIQVSSDGITYKTL